MKSPQLLSFNRYFLDHIPSLSTGLPPADKPKYWLHDSTFHFQDSAKNGFFSSEKVGLNTISLGQIYS